MMRLTLSKRRPETHDCERFYFKPDQSFDFVPGQFLKWTIPDEAADERGPNRFFSIASSPTEPEIMLCTKFAADRSSSFKSKLKALQPGEALEASGPSGNFTLEQSTSDRAVLVAGGIGVTPYRSMIKWLVDSQLDRPVKLIYGVRSEQDIPFKAEFDQWAADQPSLELEYVVSMPLTGQMIVDLAGGKSDDFFISGPEPMVEGLKDQLLNLDVPEEQVKTDYFPGYTII
jgi:glycine betaine catabolism B